MTIELRLHTTSADSASTILDPLAQTRHILETEDDEGAVSVSAGEVRRRMGAIETVILLPIAIEIGKFSSGVAAGLVANWIWSKTRGKRPAPQPVALTLVFNTGNDEQTIEIDLSSEENARQSLEAALDIAKKTAE